MRGVAYVRVDDVIKHDPLYPQLDQFNNAIAAINFEASLPHAPLTPAQIAAQTKDLNTQLQAAQARANSIIQSKQQSYGQQEHDAEVAAVKAAGIDPAAAGLGQSMNATSASAGAGCCRSGPTELHAVSARGDRARQCGDAIDRAATEQSG